MEEKSPSLEAQSIEAKIPSAKEKSKEAKSSSSLEEKITADLLGNLNPIQREAVKHKEGPLLIAAGAGSGKTRVITHRIAYLVRIHGIAPWNIAAVTFTNKAVQEMRSRLEVLLGPMAQNIFARTFHSLGLYILSRNPELAGLKPGFSILDQKGQKNLIKAIFKDHKISQDFFDPLSAANRINDARNKMLSPKDLTGPSDEHCEEISRIYTIYIRLLRKSNSVDFGDLLYESVRLLQKNAELRARYRRLWRVLLIDEYQDTNYAQYLLGRLIAHEHKNIMVVGDDDQSIYSWRGADIQNILNFEKDYPNAKILKLEENYRSAPLILKAASSLIAHNTSRRPKTLFTKRIQNEPTVFLREYGDEVEEARGVVENVLHYSSKGMPLEEMAVFYRTNTQSRVFEHILKKNRMPYLIVGDIGFYARKEIKDLLAYLNIIINPEDDLSLERIINVPARGIGDTSLARLKSLAIHQNKSLLECLGLASEIPGLRSPQKMTSLYKLFQSWRSLHKAKELPSIIAERVMQESHYLQALQKDSSYESAERIENLYELLASLREYEEECREGESGAYDGVDIPGEYDPDAEPSPLQPNLSDFLQRISLYTEEKTEGKKKASCIYLMSLHNAKGLEFPCVYLCGLEEGYLPHILSIGEGRTEEERRLLYVGITRAMKYLHLSYARQRRIFGSMQMRSPSSFLDEIGEIDGEAFACSSRKWFDSETEEADETGETDETDENTEAYAAGDEVSHKHYGNGIIVKTEEMPIGQKLSIQFEKEKRLRLFLSRYTPLRKKAKN